MLVIGLAVRHGKKNLGQVHQRETAWDAIGFIIAFSGICIQKILGRSRTAGMLLESWEENREKYGDVKVGE